MPEGFSPDRAKLRQCLTQALVLKDLARAGWIRVGVDAPESVAAHSWGVAFLVLALSPMRSDIDRGKALAMAVIHDLAESRTGDITPHDGVDLVEKAQLESEALSALLATLPHRAELHQLWRDFEEGRSIEARFVRGCDKLDMALQAQRYAETQGRDTTEFIDSALAAIEDEDLRELIEPIDGTEAAEPSPRT